MSFEEIMQIVKKVASFFSFIRPSKRECLVTDDKGNQYYVIETKLYPSDNATRKSGCYVIHNIQTKQVYIYWKV